MERELLTDLARHQIWADAQHWAALRANAQLREDEPMRKRLNHTVSACEMLQTLARGESVDPAQWKDRESMEELEAAMTAANARLAAAVTSLDLDKTVPLPRGPQGPFEAPCGVILLQAIMHGQHHRAQNAARARELGVAPPMTDFILWYALGRP